MVGNFVVFKTVTIAYIHFCMLFPGSRDDPQALVILAEEELVVLDLETESWPSFRLPYLNSIHSSAITCTHHVSNVPEQLWQKIVSAGYDQNKNFSNRVRSSSFHLKLKAHHYILN